MGNQAILDAIAAEYPRLAPHLNNTEISTGDPSAANGRLLEFYPPWEEDNPTPGKSHVQVFANLKGKELQDAVAADMLHLLGSVDPRTGQPVDPTYLGMKNKLTFTPDQHRANQETYQMDQHNYGDVGSYDDWMKHSRTDAYIRAGIFPQSNPEWEGFTSPEQNNVFGEMGSYLRDETNNSPGIGLSPAP